jgi:hypothetical protein
MRTRLVAGLGDRLALIAAVLIITSPAIPLSAQTRTVNVFPAVAASSANMELPKGAKVVASIPLNGLH